MWHYKLFSHPCKISQYLRRKSCPEPAKSVSFTFTVHCCIFKQILWGQNSEQKLLYFPNLLSFSFRVIFWQVYYSVCESKIKAFESKQMEQREFSSVKISENTWEWKFGVVDLLYKSNIWSHFKSHSIWSSCSAFS